MKAEITIPDFSSISNALRCIALPRPLLTKPTTNKLAALFFDNFYSSY